MHHLWKLKSTLFDKKNSLKTTNFDSIVLLACPFTILRWKSKGTKPKGTGKKGPAKRDQPKGTMAKRDQGTKGTMAKRDQGTKGTKTQKGPWAF